MAGSVVVLMLSGGKPLEACAVGSAWSVVWALAWRILSQAHRKCDGDVSDLPMDDMSFTTGKVREWPSWNREGGLWHLHQ
jgi:hypothetical protein